MASANCPVSRRKACIKLATAGQAATWCMSSYTLLPFCHASDSTIDSLHAWSGLPGHGTTQGWQLAGGPHDKTTGAHDRHESRAGLSLARCAQLLWYHGPLRRVEPEAAVRQVQGDKRILSVLLTSCTQGQPGCKSIQPPPPPSFCTHRMKLIFTRAPWWPATHRRSEMATRWWSHRHDASHMSSTTGRRPSMEVIAGKQGLAAHKAQISSTARFSRACSGSR